HVQGGEQERAGAAGGVEDREGRNCLVERAEQFRPLAGGDRIRGKLADVGVVGDQVVDLRNLAIPELFAQREAALPPGAVPLPDLGRQGVLGGGRTIPSVTLADVADATLNV